VWDDNGEIVMKIGRYLTKEVTGDEKLKQLLYAVRWEEMPAVQPRKISPLPSSEENCMLLTFEDEGGICKGIAEQLLLASPSSTMKTATFTQGHHSSASSVEDMRALLKEALWNQKKGEEPHDGNSTSATLRILFGWSLDSPPNQMDLMGGVAASCRTLLHLVQALAAEGLTHRTHIALFTHSVADITTPTTPTTHTPSSRGMDGGCVVESVQGGVHGMVGVIATELPELSITLYDIEAPANNSNNKQEGGGSSQCSTILSIWYSLRK